MLKHAGTYEIMTPDSVGLLRSELVLGKHSGRHALKAKLEEMGYALGDNAFQDLFKRFKDLADKKKTVFDDDIVALIEDEVGRENDRVKFVSLQIAAGSKGPQTAELELEVDGAVQSAKVEGNGPVDAIFKAIREIVPHPDCAAATLSGSCRYRRNRCAGRGHGAPGRTGQNRQRAGGGRRYDGGLCAGLYSCTEQAPDQAGQGRA